MENKIEKMYNLNYNKYCEIFKDEIINELKIDGVLDYNLERELRIKYKSFLNNINDSKIDLKKYVNKLKKNNPSDVKIFKLNSSDLELENFKNIILKIKYNNAIDLLKYFVNRVDEGSIRSITTYNKFRSFLINNNDLELSYDEWYEFFEDKINGELSESGANRELDFNSELEFEVRYVKYCDNVDKNKINNEH